jgi:hypothetical protein
MTILPIRPNTGSTLPKQVCHDLSRSLSRWLIPPATQPSGTCCCASPRLGLITGTPWSSRTWSWCRCGALLADSETEAQP